MYLDFDVLFRISYIIPILVVLLIHFLTIFMIKYSYNFFDNFHSIIIWTEVAIME
jgi:hypothetical protein